MHVYLNSIELPTTLALAIMAILGYVFGTLRERGKTCGNEPFSACSGTCPVPRRPSRSWRNRLCHPQQHHQALLPAEEVSGRIARLADRRGDSVWQTMSRGRKPVGPDLPARQRNRQRPEGIRYQSNYLMTFSEMRTDPLTGLGNRRRWTTF